MHTGKVRWFNATKGYGFVEPDDGGKDVFIHVSELIRSGIHGLETGDLVSYSTAASKRHAGKMSACNVKRAS